MPSTYTDVALHRLLQKLVAPTFADRRAADQLLWSLLSSSGDSPNPVLQALFDAATDRFGDQQAAFFEDLVHFWMQASAESFAARMRQFGSEQATTWVTPAHSATFAMTDRCAFGSWDLFGLGVGQYLVGQARRLGGLVPLFVHGLVHPEPTVRDSCWSILAVTADAAATSFPAMWSLACERGPYFAPNEPMRGLAAIVDAFPPALDTLTIAAKPGGSDNEVNVICAVVRYLAAVPASLIAAIESRYASAATAESRSMLFEALTSVARFATAAQRQAWLAAATTLSADTDAELRAAAAWGFVRLGEPREHEDALLALLDDVEWLPRYRTCRALSEWRTPSPPIVAAVGRILGSYDGFDGDPHAAALQTLIGWSVTSAAALAPLAAWLEQADPGDVDPDGLFALLDTIGAPANVLVPQVERIVAALDLPEADFDESGNGIDGNGMIDAADATTDWSDFVGQLADAGLPPAEAAALVEQQQQFQSEIDEIFAEPDVDASVDVNTFAQQLGLDINEDIPGTRPSAELVAEPTALDQLRGWLERARKS